MTWARAEKARAFIIIYSIAQAGHRGPRALKMHGARVRFHFMRITPLRKQCECPDTPEKRLPGQGPVEHTSCAAAHPADA